MSQRQERVADLIKREISDIILKTIKDPRVGFVTITRVKVSRDLKYAKIYFSVLPSLGNMEDSLVGLKSAHDFFRSELNKRIRLRYIPQLTFIVDDSLDYVEKIEQLIEKAKG
jgi:ribosome-binding factor A